LHRRTRRIRPFVRDMEQMWNKPLRGDAGEITTPVLEEPLGLRIRAQDPALGVDNERRDRRVFECGKGIGHIGRTPSRNASEDRAPRLRESPGPLHDGVCTAAGSRSRFPLETGDR
jgi:hypothetical protein